MNPLNFFAESSTLGTILVLVVYFLANLALPFYFRSTARRTSTPVKHGVLPFLGAHLDRRAGVLPLQARSGRAVRLVPLRGARGRRAGRRSTPSRWCDATPVSATGSARSSPTNDLLRQ